MNNELKNTSIRYQDLVWLFTIGSIIGFALEGVWSAIRTGAWVNHSALVWGPFCIIYGFGAIAIYLLASCLKNHNFVFQFLCYALTGTAVEYIGSLFQEKLFGTKSWSYSDHFLNINGRVSFEMFLIWGFLGIVFSFLLYPLLTQLFIKYHCSINTVICIGLSVFLIANMTVSSLAVHRWRERNRNEAPSNSIEAVLDKTYDDNRMRKIYSNMRFV